MNEARPGQPAPAWRVRLLFTATIFAGSLLLFLIQPMMARIALPRLGGAPAVWNSAMLVYQALLLGGYAYAHWLTRYSPRTQAAVHLLLLLLAALFLPISLSAANPPPGSNVFLWAPWLFLSSIGPIFFIVSAQAPLLQHWFVHSGGRNPYPMYAASNLGSFAGLTAYPLLLEPLTSISGQRLLWASAYGLLVLLVLGCAARLSSGGESEPKEVDRGGGLELRSAVKWVWLAFIPSGLMLSTTLFLTTDIMAMPLLWVIPLGLYLLSFTIAFSARSGAARILAASAAYLLVPAAGLIFFGQDAPLPITLAVLLAALFTISVACHFRIYQSRPGPRQLTGFYLAVSLGGVLGGIFSALVAPLIFDWTYEFPLLLLAAALTLLPGPSVIPLGGWARLPSVRGAAMALSAAIIIAAIWVASSAGNDALARYGAIGAFALGWIAVGSRLLLTSTMVAVMLVAGGLEKLQLSASPGRMTRTYFGVYSVVEKARSRQLLHGTTLHGVQLLTPGWQRYPTTYYGRESGVGRSLQLVPAMFGPEASVSVVGLGTGTLACYRQQHQRWTFFELDPAVVDLATRSGHFSFMPLCAPGARIVIGDARLELAREPPASADVLVVDAFSSDAVPVHLLTREAFGVYGRHLKPRGLLLVHISNRHLNLEPVVAGAPGWISRFGRFHPAWDYRHEVGSDWIAMSRSPATIEALVRLSEESFWSPTTKKTLMWTDERASLLSVFR